MGLSEAEVQFLLFIQDNIRGPVLDKIMSFITIIPAKGIVPILICLILLIIRRYRAVGLTASFALLFEVIVVNVILKNVVERIRPYDSFDALQLLGKAQDDFSFPSGHTGACFAIAFVLFFCFPKKVGIPALVVAALVGFSRLYIGIHYPTDVIAAILIAFVSAIFCYIFLYPRFRKMKLCKKKRRRA